MRFLKNFTVWQLTFAIAGLLLIILGEPWCGLFTLWLGAIFTVDWRIGDSDQ